MKEYYKRKFSLTDEGAKKVTKSTMLSFIVYVINMLPAIVLIIFAREILEGVIKTKSFYVIIAIISLILLNVFLNIEYEKLYNATYSESANLRIKIAEQLSELPLSYFSKNNLSDISQTIMSDISAIEHAISHSIPKLYGMAIFFPIISILMLIGNVKMGLAVIIPTILSFIFIFLSKKYQVLLNKKNFDILRRNSESFQENIEMQLEIKSLNIVEKMKNILYNNMEEGERAHIKSEFNMILIIVISQIFSFVGIAVVILVGINLIIKGEINTVYLISYLLCAIKIKDAIDSSKEGIMELYHLTPMINRIKEIMTQKLQKGVKTELNNYDIELKNVYFSYDKESPVLENISFKANQGEVTAIVGESGSGKTSILRLISRLYDYNTGEILIDGKDIKGISTKSLFEKISVVFQDVTLFNTSIMENIRIGKQDATEDEVKLAAKLANCDEFIEKLPKGYETIIGENGLELSGGQRQRLSIARAFLKDAPILILDEISANLDVDNEKKIQESLNRLIKNKTVIIISHRMKSIENVDKIVVIDKGKVESIGTHKELLEKSKVYRTLIEKSKMTEEFVY
ncbi:ABC transporter ATP-binding protein [Sneathia sanguinegens]|uniref:ABC transporter ATP-binding protein n=1 Tax=Sneathia sanguinegens TaxID=40543 RepID=UPI0025878F63|nr:ABC transporter ATP-binding protein [Sneathia sanguinegens]MDU4651824.1 ABC transporter ATP-binding protein [Sneathia sanguinegens]MDU7496803.1 ABC transporter ATP-binding protein [Sneathia sanguinegens]